MYTKAFRTGNNRSKKSGGFVLLLIVLSFLAISAVVLFTGIGASLTGSTLSTRRAADGNNALQSAKQILIGFVSSPPNTDYRPGRLPIPDSFANGSYDGIEDALCLSNGVNGLPAAGSAAVTKRCLGRLPWKSIGFEVGSSFANDALGYIPWLAVSANLVDDRCLYVLNSESAKLDSPAMAVCPGATFPPFSQPTALPHPWLTVVDENGTVLSNRVAAVLMLPGPPIVTETRTQQRSEANPGHPAAHLDDIKLPLGCTSGCTTFDNAGLSNVFISIAPGTKYPMNAQDVPKRGQPLAFNDQLVYVTIDELIPYIERRVAGQMAAALRAFKASTLFTPNSYPWMAPFVVAPSLTTSLTSGAGTIFGMFPFMSATSAASQSDYRTDFDWTLTGFSETLSTACRRIGSGPNRYVRNTLTNSIAAPLSVTNIASGTVPLANGVCQWRGTNRVSCNLATGQTITTTFQQSMTIYSNNTCTAPVGPATLTISREITSLILDVGCVSPMIGYTTATAGDVHRWSSSCASIITGAPPSGLTVSSISLSATDMIDNFGVPTYSLLPTTVTVTLVTPIAGNKQVVSNRMRYHPTMPGWFHENLWYRTAFAAVAPSFPSAPSTITPCGVVTTLTAGSRQGIEALAIQAGSNLPLTGARPSGTIADYLEGQNLLNKGGAAPGMTNCTFDSAPTMPTTLANDQLIVVSP